MSLPWALTSGTPVWTTGAFNLDFPAEVESGIKGLLVLQQVRRAKYREAADDFSAGFTSTEIREKREAKLYLEPLLQSMTTDVDDDDAVTFPII